MKKLLLAAIFILTGLGVFAQNAVIEQLTGTVEIKHPGEDSFKSAKSGDTLFNDTVISTGFKSYALVKIGSTTLMVKPITLLSLSEIQKTAEAETLNVRLHTGRVRVDVKPPAGLKADTTLTCPGATASVRGTSFEFDTDNLYVSEGTVSFIGNRGQNMFVSAGESSHVERTRCASNPRDRRNAVLMPPSPVGTDTEKSAASGSAPVRVDLVIGLQFGEEK